MTMFDKQIEAIQQARKHIAQQMMEEYERKDYYDAVKILAEWRPIIEGLTGAEVTLCAIRRIVNELKTQIASGADEFESHFKKQHTDESI